MNTETNEEPFLKIRIPKKSSSIIFVDVMTILEECESETDDRFFYVSFEKPTNTAKKLSELATRLKGTKFWFNGREVEEHFSLATETIFCVYRDKCDGKCMHDLGLNLGEHSYFNHPLYEEMLSENESVLGLEKWLEENKELKPNYTNYHCLIKMKDYFIVVFDSLFDADLNEIIIQKEYLVKYVENKLIIELGYCPIIFEEKTLEFQDKIPDKIIITEETKNFFIGRLTDREGVKEDTDEEEIHSFPTLIKAIGEEIEERFRKVLSEFFEKKN